MRNKIEKKMLKADKRYLTKHAIEVKTKDDLLEGKEAIDKKHKGRVVKGENNYLIGRSFGLKYR